MTKNTISFGNRKIYYWVRNPHLKPTLIVLHGLRGNHTALIPFADRFKNHRVILIDLPGHGESEPLTKQHTLKNFALLLESFVSQLKLKEVVVWGHSYGAAIAMEYAASQDYRLSKLVLVCPAISADNLNNAISGIYYKSTLYLPKSLQRMWVANPLIEYIVKNYLIKNVGVERRKELVRAGQRELQSLNPTTIAEAFESYRTNDWLQSARAIKVPTLIIAGGKDEVIPLQRIRRLQKLLHQAKLTTIANHGHLAPVEVPFQIARLTQDFIKQQDIKM